MPAHFGPAVLAFLFSLAVLVTGGQLMTRASGHGIVAAALKKADLTALNLRLVPYGAHEAAEVWTVISDTQGGLASERAFLRLDLLFPLLYGGALALSIMAVLYALGAPSIWWLTPVVVAAIADWTENTIHLRQLNVFDGSASSLDAGLMTIAGYATPLKLICVALSLMLIPLLPWILRARVV